MKLPVNAFLYLISAGLLGVAGFTFYKTFPDQNKEAREARSQAGIAQARDLIAKGKKGGEQVDRNWNYGDSWWKEAFLSPNVLGKEKKVAEQPKPGEPGGEPIVRTIQPLDEIIELVTVCYDSDRSKGDLSHVIVRYKGQVTPPEWYARENQPVTGASSAPVGPADGVAAAPNGRGGNRGGGNRGARSGAPATSAMPMGSAGAEMLQRVWVAGDNKPRFENKLWDPYGDIKLVRVSEDAKSAWFIRTPPPPKEGEKPVEAKPEELFRTTMPMTQDVAAAVADILRTTDPARARIGGGAAQSTQPEASGEWIDDPSGETKKAKDGRFHIGRKDQQIFGEDPNTLMQRVNAESYVSRNGGALRGVLLRNVDPQLAQRFGVQAGEVIISVNGEKVETKADAMAIGKKQYNRGARTFVVKFLSNGQQLERTYQAPNR